MLNFSRDYLSWQRIVAAVVQNNLCSIFYTQDFDVEKVQYFNIKYTYKY
jgi:hypothetical protein